MRNCFVPKCDNICKNQPRRMMFLPPKDAELFEVWKSVLPKKREFKTIDKVCERHFSKDDIITTFDHIINGELLQMERGRPRLKRTAVPSLNLEADLSVMVKTPTKRSGIPKGTRLKKCPKKSLKQDSDRDSEDIKQASVCVKEDESASVTQAVALRVKTEFSSAKDMEDEEIQDENIFNEEIVLEQFETLYDDVFEVTLPTLLWGIHREPERQFIAFSCFDVASMRITKYVVLNSIGCLKITINGKMISEQILTDEITPEFISNILSEVEDTAFCLKSTETENSNCEVIAAAGSEFCVNCS